MLHDDITELLCPSRTDARRLLACRARTRLQGRALGRAERRWRGRALPWRGSHLAIMEAGSKAELVISATLSCSW